jgi:hypothetical protein
VIAAFDDTESGRCRQRREDGREFVGRAEGVAGTLHEQHRGADCREVFRSRRVGATRRMQGIAEQDQAHDRVGVGGGDLGGDAPAHRLAADRELAASTVPADRTFAKGLDDAAPAGFQLVIAVGKAPARFAVDEVERDGFDPACGERAGD